MKIVMPLFCKQVKPRLGRRSRSASKELFVFNVQEPVVAGVWTEDMHMQQQFAGPEQVCTSGQNKERLEGMCTRANGKVATGKEWYLCTKARLYKSDMCIVGVVGWIVGKTFKRPPRVKPSTFCYCLDNSKPPFLFTVGA